MYKLTAEELGRGANTVVKGCVNCITNQEYAVKVHVPVVVPTL